MQQSVSMNTTSLSIWFLVPNFTNFSAQSMKSSAAMIRQKMCLLVSVFILMARSRSLSLNFYFLSSPCFESSFSSPSQLPSKSRSHNPPSSSTLHPHKVEESIFIYLTKFLSLRCVFRPFFRWSKCEGS
jgi:hypothetical protein